MGDRMRGTARSTHWAARTSRVLIFTLVVSAFMMQGWSGPHEVQAAAVWQNTGAVVTAAGAVAWPAHQVNDVALLFVETANEAVTLSTPAGFVEVTDSPQFVGSSGGIGSTRLTVYWARATSGSMTSPVIGGSYNHVVAVIVTFRGVSSVGNPYEATAGSVKDTASTSTDFPAVTTLTPGTLIVLAAAVDLDSNSTNVWSAFTNANLTGLAERVDQTTSTGRGGGLGVATGAFAGPGNTGTTTGTLNSSITTQMTIALTPTENRTITMDASATAASATSILVTMPYRSDSNANNTYTVDYKQSTASAWVNWTSNAAHVASPYTTTITGLTAGELYDVRMAYNDADGVLGSNPQTAEKIVLGPSNGTTAGYVLVKAKKNSVRVRMPFYNDANGNGTFKVEYKLSTVGTWSTWVTGAVASFSPYTTTITSLQPGTKYDIRTTYTDADGTAGFGAGNPRVQTIANVATNELLHSSNTTLSSKWTGSRGWGYTGAKYGEFVCDTCHVKTTTNIKRVRTGIGTPDASTWVSSGTRTVSVNFQSATTPNGFGDDTTAHATSTKVCEVCHSQNSFHNYNQTTTQTHRNNTDCMSGCHSHSHGFAGDGPCKSCHSSAITEVYNTRQVSGAGGDFVRLSRHVSDGSATEIVTDYDCIVCHAEGDADAAAGGMGYVDTARHRIGSTAVVRNVKLRNVDNINQVYDWNKNAVTEVMRTNMDTFCLNCHDSDGSKSIAVTGPNTAPVLSLAPSAAAALSPFNDTDNFRNGRDGLTSRTRVIDVKSQFVPGSGGTGAGYNGNPSQHAVLGGRYSTTNASWTATAWTGHTLRNGQVMNTARETARLHCSDCHLAEQNAHGAANAWHLLMNGQSGDFTTDYDMGGKAPTDTASIVCYKCHSSSVYANVASTANTRFSHNRESRVWAANYGDGTAATDGAVLGASCLLCHAGDGFGNIHGVSGTYTSNGDTFTRYRFMNGAWMYWDPGTSAGDAAWTDPNGTNGTCYMPPSSSWTGCTQHADGAAGTQAVNFGRAVKY